MSCDWNQAQQLASKGYVCGHCGNPLASEKGWFGKTEQGWYEYIYICHHCNKPTYFNSRNDEQVPGVHYGKNVDGVSDELVQNLYDEARRCISVNSYTAAVLCCRKLLMHIAVSKGAKEGQGFVDYVQYLADNHYISPGAEGWVDYIREKGNEANHEIVVMNKTEAKDLIDFSEMLLRTIYEFPATIQKRKTTNNTNEDQNL